MHHSKNTSGITVAMLRAFVSLSAHLNLSKACEEIGATRQTVRRHITELEAIKGEALFEVTDRQYRLTPHGHAALPGAQSILQQMDSWSGHTALTRNISGGLEASRFVDADGRHFHSQQHPVSRIALNGLPLVRHALVAWANAEAKIEHAAMENIRPYAILFRKGPAGWVFVDVGSESAYSKWFGWTWSRSAIGKLLNEDDTGDDYNEFIAGAYSRIYEEGGVRYDHILVHVSRDGGPPQPATFQRLLLGCVFPDGTPGLYVLVAITKKVEIDALDPAEIPDLDPELIMDSLPDGPKSHSKEMHPA